jgi:hypothetical protein
VRLTRVQICVGLHRLCVTLEFLHGIPLAHNRVCLDAVFVSEIDGSWKVCRRVLLCVFV